MAEKNKKDKSPAKAPSSTEKEHGEIFDSVATIEKVDGRSGADTFRLWEAHKEQAFFWRIVALAQMPITIVSLIFALIVYSTADIIIEPPEAPQPGMYSINRLPDSEFLKMGVDIVNLIGTYQPASAEKQFRTVRLFLWEPALSEFEKIFLDKEIPIIKDLKRSQAFMINNDLVQVQRYPNQDMVIVRIPGTRQMLIGKSPLDDEVTYYLKMTTIPKSPYNPKGIVVFDVRIKKQTAEDLRKLDERRNLGGR
jgi:hypothetical protein